MLAGLAKSDSERASSRTKVGEYTGRYDNSCASLVGLTRGYVPMNAGAHESGKLCRKPCDQEVPLIPSEKKIVCQEHLGTMS